MKKFSNSMKQILFNSNLYSNTCNTNTVLYCTDTVLYYAVLYYTVLYYTVLQI